MLRKTMVVLATAAALTGGLTAESRHQLVARERFDVVSC
jgi:hypothetical protein